MELSQQDRRPERPRAGRTEKSRERKPVATAVVRVDAGDAPEHLFRRLVGAYLAGHEEFVVHAERGELDEGVQGVLTTFCRRTHRPEIVADDHRTVRLRDVEFRTPVSLPDRIARMGRCVVDFHREAVGSWSSLPFVVDGYWGRRDDDIDREAWYIQRWAGLHAANGADGTAGLGAWTIARSLERIADHAVVLGEAGGRLVARKDGAKVVVPLRQLHRQAMEHLTGVLGARDGREANELLDVGEALLESGRTWGDRWPAFPRSISPTTMATAARVLDSMSRTVAYAQDIGQVLLEDPSALTGASGALADR